MVRRVRGSGPRSARAGGGQRPRANPAILRAGHSPIVATRPGAPRRRHAAKESLMQFGLFMMPLHPPYRSFADAYDRDIDQIVLADQLGFAEAWVGEHLTE